MTTHCFKYTNYIYSYIYSYIYKLQAIQAIQAIQYIYSFDTSQVYINYLERILATSSVLSPLCLSFKEVLPKNPSKSEL